MSFPIAQQLVFALSVKCIQLFFLFADCCFGARNYEISHPKGMAARALPIVEMKRTYSFHIRYSEPGIVRHFRVPLPFCVFALRSFEFSLGFGNVLDLSLLNLPPDFITNAFTFSRMISPSSRGYPGDKFAFGRKSGKILEL